MTLMNKLARMSVAERSQLNAYLRDDGDRGITRQVIICGIAGIIAFASRYHHRQRPAELRVARALALPIGKVAPSRRGCRARGSLRGITLASLRIS
jgi:hypothetical protein